MDKIFISYSGKHPVYARLLSEELEREGFRTWIYQRDLTSGRDWEESLIRTIIEDCFALIVIVTQEAMESATVRKEVETAVQKNKVVLPLIFEDLENIASTLQEISPDLQRIQAFNFVEREYYECLNELKSNLRREADHWSQLEGLINQLAHYSPLARRNAVMSLAASQDKRVLSELLSVWKLEVDLEVQIALFEAFAQLGEGYEARTILVFLLSNKLSESRIEVRRTQKPPVEAGSNVRRHGLAICESS